MADYKVNEDYTPSEEDIAYRQMLSKSRPRFDAIKPTTAQSASTQKILDAHAKGETLVQFKEPLPDYHVRDENGDIFINERPLSVNEVVGYETLRRGAKNQLGESKKSVASEEQKEAARHAYTYSEPAPLTEVETEKLTKMDAIKELNTMPKTIEWKPIGPWKAFKLWATGKKIRYNRNGEPK